MHTEYFAKWFRAKSQGIQALTIEEALLRHQRQEPYVALLSEKDRLLFLVDIAGPWVSVNFFDEYGRLYIDYDFRTENEASLFLKGALHRCFGEDGKVSSSCQFNFEPDGSYFISAQDGEQHRELRGKADASPLLADYPSFGCYEHLCTTERTPYGT